MAIITISRGSFSMGKRVAEKVAGMLGYSVVSRDLLLDASERYHIPEIKLIRAIHDAPGILERFSHNKQSYLAYIRAALARRISDDNVVYHGLAGHVMLKGISGVLKVRIIADLKMRVAREMEREKISAQEARALLVKDDHQRRGWTKSIHGVDPWDSNLYDLVIRIGQLSVDDAATFICHAAESDGFRITEERLIQVKDFSIACQIKAELVEDFPFVGVVCQYGNVVVYSREREPTGGKLAQRIDRLREEIDGVFNIEIHTVDGYPEDAV
jgi:cytidylate kinase